MEPVPARSDVAVIGAGYTGLAAALTLAKRAVEVTIVEAADIGWGASSRNGGMVLSGLKRGPRELVARFGLESARRFDAASIAAINTVERIIREEAIECAFERCGHIALAAKPAHYVEFQRDAELVSQQFGRSLRVISKAALKDEVGSDVFWGGLIDEASASLQPAEYVAGLAQAARRAGATICTSACVHTAQREAYDGARGFRLKTSRGDLLSREVFVATGGYTGPQFPALHKRVIPIGSYVIATEPLEPDLARAVSPRNRMMFDSKHFLHYFRLTPDQRFLFGGRAAFVPESPEAVRESAAILRHDMLRTFPQLAQSAVDRVWGGTIDFTFDLLPHAGRLEGMYYALGYAGHGVAMATHLGAQTAQLMLGESTYDPLLGRPFPTAPLGMYSGARWVAPLAGAWFKLLDLVS